MRRTLKSEHLTKLTRERRGSADESLCCNLNILRISDGGHASSKQAAQLSFSNRSRGGREIAGARGVVYCLKYKVHNYT